MVMADKAYWSKARSEWCGEHGVTNEILRKLSRGLRFQLGQSESSRHDHL